MVKYFLILVVTFAFILSSCGEDFEDLKNVATAIKNAPDVVEEMTQAQSAAEKKREERVAKGDTLAMHFSELQKFLPSSLSGFEASEPEGQTTSAMGYSMSQVDISFTNSEGRRINVSLMDYNAAYGLYLGLASWGALGISSETSDGFERAFKTDNEAISGMEEFSKKNTYAKVVYAVGYRFILTIEDNGADGIDFVKDVASKMDLKKLSNI